MRKISMVFEINIKGTDESFKCIDDDSVLDGMTRSRRSDIPIGCSAGGCGICKVEVISGEYSTGNMSRQHVSLDEKKLGKVLACRVFPKSNLMIKVIRNLKKHDDHYSTK